MNANFSCFITGTDTEIGKTLISSAMVHILAQKGVRVVGMKPIASGATNIDGKWRNEDMDKLIEESNLIISPQLVTPYLFRTPAAPHISASLENTEIRLGSIKNAYDEIIQSSDAIVVEGVGGFCVPLSDQEDTADLAKTLNLPVILIVGLKLGCINHALLTAEAIRARGLKLAGWVANLCDKEMSYVDENISAIAHRIHAPLLGKVPYLDSALAKNAAQYLDFSSLSNWPKST